MLCYPRGAPCRTSQLYGVRARAPCASQLSWGACTLLAAFRAGCTSPEILLWRFAPTNNWFHSKGKKAEFFKSSQPQLRDSLWSYQTEFSRVEIPALISPGPGRRGVQSSGWRCSCWMPCAPLCVALTAVPDPWCYTSLMLKKEQLTKLSSKQFAPKLQPVLFAGKRLQFCETPIPKIPGAWSCTWAYDFGTQGTKCRI